MWIPDHLPPQSLRLGGLKFLHGLILFREGTYKSTHIYALFGITHSYFKEVYQGKYSAYDKALQYYQHASDTDVMLDYIRYSGVNMADKNIVTLYYKKMGMAKPQAHQSSTRAPAAMAAVAPGTASAFASHGNSAFGKPSAKGKPPADYASLMCAQ